MTFQDLFTLIRIIIYSWVVYECIVTAFIYWEATRKQQSVMMETLTKLLFAIAFTITWFSLITVVRITNINLYLELLKSIFIPMIFVGYYVRKFRHWSLHSENNKCPYMVNHSCILDKLSKKGDSKGKEAKNA